MLTGQTDWHTECTTEELLETFKDFAPSLRACMEKARDVKHRQLCKETLFPPGLRGELLSLEMQRIRCSPVSTALPHIEIAY